MNNAPRIMALYGDENGCTWWRCKGPYRELQILGYGAWGRHKNDPSTYAEEFPYLAATRLDAIVVARMFWGETTNPETGEKIERLESQMRARRWVDALHRAGLAVIYEVDDDVFTPQIGERQQATTEANKSLEQLNQERLDRIAALRLCDGVTVSSTNLADVVKKYVDTPVCVVPNSIDIRWWRSVLRGVRRVVPPLTVGWQGGARYAEDLEPIAESWHNIAQRYPDVHFVIQGYTPEVLIDAVPADRVHLFQWRPAEEYLLDTLNVDIGCANVAAKHFNRCKTPIKLWEYTMAGAVSVVSPTLYGPVASDGEDCLVAESTAEWESALARLIDDAQLRRRLWRAQRRRVAEFHSLQRNACQWLEAWSTIIESFRAKQQRRVLLAA